MTDTTGGREEVTLTGCFGFLLLGLLVPVFVGVLIVSQDLALPAIDSVILHAYYDPVEIEAADLRIVYRGANLKVSNGDVLPRGAYYINLFLSLLSGAIGITCAVFVLKKLDRYVFRGWLGTVLSALWRQFLKPSDDKSSAHWTDGTVDVAERLEKALTTSSSHQGTLLWYNSEARFAAVVDACEYLKERDVGTVVVFHFSAGMTAFLDRAAGVQEKLVVVNQEAAEQAPGAAMIVGMADDLSGQQVADRVFAPDRECVCILADCHPLAARDEEVMRHLSEQPGVRAVLQFMSLDETPLQTMLPTLFEVHWTTDFDKQHRAYEHWLINGSTQKARAHYDRSRVGDVKTASSREWIEVNCPAN